MYLRVLLHLEKKVWNCVAVLTLRQKTKQYPNKQKTLRSVSLFFFFFFPLQIDAFCFKSWTENADLSVLEIYPLESQGFKDLSCKGRQKFRTSCEPTKPGNNNLQSMVSFPGDI